MTSQAAIDYVKAHLEDLKWRDVLQELLTLPDRLMVQTDPNTGKLFVEKQGDMYVGKLVLNGDLFYRVTAYQRVPNTRRFNITVQPTSIPYREGEVLVDPTTPCTLEKGVVANFTEDKPIETKIGRVITNFFLFADPFGATIPYVNKPMRAGWVEALLANCVISEAVSIEDYYKYVSNKDFLLNSPEFIAPNLTPKSLVTDPAVKQRKRELIEQLKDRLAAGDATAMAEIESELIKMDKNWLKDDPSMRFMLKGKYFTNVRKKLLLTHGSVESFSDAGQYAFVPNSLEEGWTQGAFPVIANEIRSGSYSRARETAKGGEESKFLLRVFQNTRIIEQDCGSKTGLVVPIRAHNADNYIYRNYFTASGLESVTEETASNLIGRDVTFRSPMFCDTKNGYCYTCMGKLFEKLGQKVLASAVNEIGSAMLARALAKVHKSGVEVVELGPLTQYVVR